MNPICVVVITYNSAHVIADLLDTVPGAMDGIPHRIAVVDNSSTDDTRAIVSARTDCELVTAPNLGYSAGINRGVAALGGHGPVLVLNPDVRLAAGSVRRLLETLAQPRTGIVGPKVLDEHGALVPSLRREPTLLRALGFGRSGRATLAEYVVEPEAYDEPQTADWVLGAVLLVARDCFEELGGWDESFFLYSEETDFCLRARDRGWVTRYEPAAVTTHIGAQSGYNPQIHSMQILNRVRLYRRRHGLLASVTYYLLSIASELSWLVRGHRQSATSITGLLRPSTRPAVLGCSSNLIPR